MNIYTRNGDFGFTTNIYGHKLSKASLQLDLQGSIDEVNSGTGYLRALIEQASEQDDAPIMTLGDLSTELKEIQHKLFEMGTDISMGFSESKFTAKDVTNLEKAIDSMLESTGELHHFLCLSGKPAAGWCHVLRSTTRRAERVFVAYIQENKLDPVPQDYRYINRLADYYFQLARYLNHLFGFQEEGF